MKRLPIRLTLLLLTLAALAGCSYEIESRYCPLDPEENNVVLDFILEDLLAQDIFDANVNTIDVFVFDKAGKFHSSKTVTRTELDSFRGVIMTLAPGDYSVVAWVNRTVKCSASPAAMTPGVTTLTDCCLDYNSTAGCDFLFYGPGNDLTKSNAPLKISVPDQGSVRKTMPMAYAHKVIAVFVEGYTYNGLTNVMPNVKLDGIWRGYDFLRAPLKDSPLAFSKLAQSVTTPEGPMANANFVVTGFEDDNTITLRLENPVGGTDYTLVLNDFITVEQIDLAKEVVIPVVIRFSTGDDGIGVRVTIDLPTWSVQGIIPQPM